MFCAQPHSAHGSNIAKATSMERKLTVRRLFGSECPQCGAEVIAPEWAEHVSTHRVRNTWSCDICDCQFEEAVCLSVPELAGVN
jgi:hypothetical protein